MTQREYILDTSVFRGLNAEEAALIENVHQVRLTATYVVPLELLSGIAAREHPKAEQEFRMRRAAMRKYDQLVGINSTDWTDEDVLTARAFGIQKTNTEKKGLQLLVKMLVDSKDYDDFLNLNAELKKLNGDAVTLQRARAQDTLFAGNATRALKRIHELNASFPDFKETGYLKTYIFLLLGQFAGALNVPLDVLAKSPLEVLRQLENELRPRYDGSLDFDIELNAAYWEELRAGRRPLGKKGRNDSLDLKHIRRLKLDEPNQFFVTRDGNLLQLGRKVLPDRVIDTAQFMTLVEQSR